MVRGPEEILGSRLMPEPDWVMPAAHRLGRLTTPSSTVLHEF